jgi:hypothetical protein
VGKSGFVNARRWDVVTWLDTSAIDSFARLAPHQSAVLRKLQQRSRQVTEVLALGGRVLLTLPRDHPSGVLELLLAEDLGRLVVRLRGKKISASLPLDRLPDILDGVSSSERAHFSLDLKPYKPSARDRDKVLTTGLAAGISLRYSPPSRRASSWPIQLHWKFRFPDQPQPAPECCAHQQPLMHVALPLLECDWGRQLLQSLTFHSNLPLGWSVTVINEGKPGGTPPTLLARVIDHGHVRIPADRMAEKRQGFQRLQVLPPPASSGMQLVAATQLAELRSGAAKGPLLLRNRSDLHGMIFVDGVLVAWVGRGKELALKGLAPGYYRVYAVSPTGVRYWGPRDTYVPGALTLR